MKAGRIRIVRNRVSGLWLVRADACEQVEHMMKADPFRPAGLRKAVRIVEWRRVFADGSGTAAR